jgi:hypothetical protein
MMPDMHTYHCVCTQLLFASTTPLNLLPQRQDKSYVLPLPPPPRASNTVDAGGEDGLQTPLNPTGKQNHYALLLSTTLDRKAQIIRRSDGFEKRWMQRCGRCRLIVGYQLDWAQYADNLIDKGDGAGKDEKGEKDENSKRVGRREDVVYMLSEGLTSTEEMISDKGSAR